MKKKSIINLFMVFVLSCAIIFGCTAFFRPKLEVLAESNWQSEENINVALWYDELTYEDVTVYSISSAEQLAGLAKLVNSGVSFEGKIIKVKDTITLGTFVERETEDDDYVLETGFEWVPIGTKENPFKGTFDAQNNVIKGVYINNSNEGVGLFGYVEGTLKNINIVDSYIKGNSFVGSIAGNFKGTADYCYSSATVVANAGAKKVGGLFGCVEGSVEEQTVITNSYTTNNLELVVNNEKTDDINTTMVGGVIGCAKQNVLIENTYNRAEVKATASYVGGVVGFATDDVEISHSYNDGKVFVENSESRVEIYVGGVVGAIVNGSVNNSYNTGDVDTNAASVGGVAGMISTTDVNNSYNSGVVEGFSYVGGVAGTVKELSSVLDCHNQADIVASYVEGYVGENIAGVVGYNNNSEIKYCYNSANVVYKEAEETVALAPNDGQQPVVETKNVAGVIGKNEKGSAIAVYNTGVVGDANSTYVAGIIAENNAGKVETSINIGEVFAKDIVAGVVVNNINGSIVKNCLSSSEIATEEENGVVGGLVGLNDKTSFVYDSYFNSELVLNSEPIAQNLAPEDNVKNALGYDKSNMKKIKVELSDGSSCVGIIESFNQVAKNETDSKWVASIDTNNGTSNIIFNVATKNALSVTEVLAIILGAIAVLILGIYVGVYIKETRIKAAIPEFDGYGKDDVDEMEDNM